MTFIYDVSLPGAAPYTKVVSDRIRSSVELRLELIAAGHPADVEIRLRRGFAAPAARRAQYAARANRRFS